MDSGCESFRDKEFGDSLLKMKDMKKSIIVYINFFDILKS